jgi:hypothetical protein
VDAIPLVIKKLIKITIRSSDLAINDRYTKKKNS